METNLLVPAGEPRAATFTLRLDGATAADGAVEIADLSAALDGLKTFLNASTELYFSGGDPNRGVPAGSPLRIEVRPPKVGSFTVVITAVLTYAGMRIVDGVIGNRADATVVWSYDKLQKWYQRTFKTHIEAKTSNADKAEIVRRLQQMVSEEQPPLAPSISEEINTVESDMFDADDVEKAGPEPSRDNRESFVLGIVDQIDMGLYDLSEPVGASCEIMEFEDQAPTPIFSIGAVEREILRRPLLPPRPADDWLPAKVRFIRINKETGSCIFQFLSGSDVGDHRRGRIVDSRLRQPRDAYTQSFSLEKSIDLWLRPRLTDRGGTFFELSLEMPDIGLFGAA